MIQRYIVLLALALAILATRCPKVFAYGYLSNLPVLGDRKAAEPYVSLGNKALAAGDVSGAMTEFRRAEKLAPGEEFACLGLARCYAAQDDYLDASICYKGDIDRNLKENPIYSIELLTEYTMMLQKAGEIRSAIITYNKALELCKGCYSCMNEKMETYPNDFALDGSDYNASDMAAVTHVMRALYFTSPDLVRSERLAALAANPNSPIVKYYDQILLDKAKEADAALAPKVLPSAKAITVTPYAKRS